MDTRVDINIEASVFRNKDRDFVQEVDDFIYGGFVDWIRRDDTGCYVKLHDGWIPVVDWMKKYEFPGARNLTHLARYFFNLGQMEVKKPAEWNANDKAFIKDCAHILDENGYAASAERLLSMFPVKPAEPEDG